MQGCRLGIEGRAQAGGEVLLFETGLGVGRVIMPDPGVVLVPEAFARRLTKAGAVVWKVVKDSPAHKKGIEPGLLDEWGRFVTGDIVVGVDGKPVRSNEDYYTLLERFSPGDEVEFTIQRGRAVFQQKLRLIPNDWQR